MKQENPKNSSNSVKPFKMEYEDITHKIIGAAYKVYNQLARPPRLRELQDNDTMFYTYVLQSESDKKYYMGYTKELKRRVAEHNNGLVTSTANRRPLKLIYYEACLKETDAVKREKYFKTGFGRRFIKNRLENFLNELG